MQEQINIRHALNEKDGFQVWWRLLRPHTLTASFVPVLLGTMLAYADDFINIFIFIAMLFASMLIQAATNMFNEYYDFTRGLDNEQSVGIGGTIVRDGVAPIVILRIAIIFFAAAILLGVYISIMSSWWIAVIGVICMAFGYFYTGGPFPIAYTPFGELTAGFLMGTVIISISYFVQTATLKAEIIWLSIPVAIFIGTIMLANNIRDLDGDKENGRQTIAILLGRKNAIHFLACMFIVAYGFTGYFIMTGLLPLYSIIVFLTIKKTFDIIRNFRGKSKPIEMLPAMIATGKTNTIFGFLLVISLFLHNFF